MSPAHVAIFAVAGGAGCALRVAVRDAMMRRGVHPWWSTCSVNLAGALAMGAICAWIAREGTSIPPAVAVAATGVLGGWTTYSAFAMDVVQLWLRGNRASAVALWAITMAGAPLAALAASSAFRLIAGSAP